MSESELRAIFFKDASHWILEDPMFWLVVDQPLWKIWIRQLGWWDSQYDGKIKKKCSKPATRYYIILYVIIQTISCTLWTCTDMGGHFPTLNRLNDFNSECFWRWAISMRYQWWDMRYFPWGRGDNPRHEPIWLRPIKDTWFSRLETSKKIEHVPIKDTWFSHYPLVI